MLNHKNIRNIAIIGALILVIGISLDYISFVWLIIWLLIWIAFTAWGSFAIQSNYFLKAIHQNSTIQKPFVALTFDDGPHPNTEKILDLLKAYQMKATFFCIGKEIEKHPSIIQRMVEEGHIVGNHTYSHTSKMGFLKTKEVIDEIEKTNTIIESITHKKPDLFRPPFGVTNPNIAKAIADTDMKVIGWNIRSLDTIYKSSEQVVQRVVPQLHKGAIVLLHDNLSTSIETLEQLLCSLQEKQLQSVTIPELLNIKAYKS